MNARRAGQGCNRDAPPREAPDAPQVEATAPVAKLGDLPSFRAALEYARADVEAYEQTEAAWRSVWGDS